jgi:hypothetical protein
MPGWTNSFHPETPFPLPERTEMRGQNKKKRRTNEKEWQAVKKEK